MARINISLRTDLADELSRVVPARKRSAFIAAAVEEKLRRERQVRAARAAAGAWSGEGRGDVEAELRALRDRTRKGEDADG